eukprot:1356082-Pyramimonas_sp.AAC.1
MESYCTMTPGARPAIQLEDVIPFMLSAAATTAPPACCHACVEKKGKEMYALLRQPRVTVV